MTILESILICCACVGFFIVFFIICAGIYWIFKKIGFVRWLRGWLWYFGWGDKCPDAKRNR